MERHRPRKNFGVSLEQAIGNDALRELYFTERTGARRAGESVWVVRNFAYFDSGMTAGSGMLNEWIRDAVLKAGGFVYTGSTRVTAPKYDYFTEDKPRGYVEGIDDVGFDVYAITKVQDLDNPLIEGPADEHEVKPHHLNTEPLESLSQAMKMLEDYIKDTAI